MNIAELRTNYKENKNLEEYVKVKKYVKLSQKIAVIEGFETEEDDREIVHINGIVDDVIVEKDGIHKLDFMAFELHSMYHIIDLYTDIEINDDFTIDDYDFIKENEICDFIMNSGNCDIYDFMDTLRGAINKELENRNSLSSVVNKALEKVTIALSDLTDSKKMNKMLKSLSKGLEKNPELKEYMKAFVDKNGKGA